MIIYLLCHVCDVTIRYYYCTTVKCRKTAVHSHHRTVMSLDFWSTALLRYGQHPYGAVLCTAVTVYGTVESPNYSAWENLAERATKINQMGMDMVMTSSEDWSTSATTCTTLVVWCGILSAHTKLVSNPI
jgi:hypothetical protein